MRRSRSITTPPETPHRGRTTAEPYPRSGRGRERHPLSVPGSTGVGPLATMSCRTWLMAGVRHAAEHGRVITPIANSKLCDVQASLRLLNAGCAIAAIKVCANSGRSKRSCIRAPSYRDRFTSGESAKTLAKGSARAVTALGEVTAGNHAASPSSAKSSSFGTNSGAAGRHSAHSPHGRPEGDG